jgi:hypothetical protein
LAEGRDSKEGVSGDPASPAEAAYRKLAEKYGADEIPVPQDPEEAYALRLAEFGEDYSECGQEATASTQTCENRPPSASAS